MNIRWCRRGLRSLAEIIHFLGDDDPSAARKTSAAVEHCLKQLADTPEAGGPSRREGVRELSVGDSPYQMLYRIHDEKHEIHILELFHVARRRPYHW